MNYIILSVVIIFCAVHSSNCEICDFSRLNSCEIVIENNLFWTYKCCDSHHKNGHRKAILEEDEMCTPETVYCCPNLSNNNLCENSLKDFLSKSKVLPTYPRIKTSHERSNSFLNKSSKPKSRTSNRRSNHTSSSTTTHRSNSEDNENPNGQENSETKQLGTIVSTQDSENKSLEMSLVLTEFDRFRNRESLTFKETVPEVSVTKEPQIEGENQENHNIKPSNSNSTELQNTTHPNTSDSNARNDSQAPTNETKVDQTMITDDHKIFNKAHINDIENETNNQFSVDNTQLPVVDSSNKSSFDAKQNKTIEIPQNIENTTTTTEFSIITKSTESLMKFTTPIIPLITPKITTTTIRPMRKSEQKCIEYGKSTIQKISVMGLIGHKPREITIDKCRHKAIPLIVGGREAMPYEFPHQALLGYEDYNDRVEWKCGGSLVSRNFILTAAHCIFDFDLGSVKIVKLGAFNQFEDSEKTILRRVVSTMENPDYDRLNRIDDIGLLKLDDFVQLNEYINPVCLPIKQAEQQYAIAIGFGSTETSFRSRRLMKVVLEKFEPHYPSRIKNDTLVDKFIFYGHRTQRRDTCSGDSGSPLQISNDMNVKCSYTQIGIVSYGPNECGIPGLPAVYTNVFYYVDWITQYIWEDEDRLEEESKS